VSVSVTLSVLERWGAAGVKIFWQISIITLVGLRFDLELLNLAW